MPYKEQHVVEFWNWFASNASRIHDAYRRDEDGWLDTNISPRIDRIADHLNWELGPYNDPDDTFVLSPTIRDNLPVTRAAIAIAPQIAGWHFLPAKPAKELLSLTFCAHECKINADDWRYRLTAYNNGEFVEIEIFVNASSGFPSGLDDLFCELVIESLLGEEYRLDRVGYLILNIVNDNTTIEKSTSIKHLKDHLAQVLRPAQNEA
ncbi:MAG: hypothetical protein AAFN77_24350 [Planctomycetota bacterium]